MGEENIWAGPLANNVWFDWMHGKLHAQVARVNLERIAFPVHDKLGDRKR
jgi:hypothetical protein